MKDSTNGGNLFVLASDISLGVGLIYRFSITDPSSAITSSTVEAITQTDLAYRDAYHPLIQNGKQVYGVYQEIYQKPQDYFYLIGEAPQSFYIDGARAYTLLANDLKVLEFGNRMSTKRFESTVIVDIGQGESECFVGKAIRDDATGAIIIPGSWGIILNQ